MKLLLFVGLVAVLTFASLRYGFGPLPGDIVIDRGDGFYFYAPFTTALLVSVLLSLVFWLFRR
jgi:hypothetical protein